MKRWHIWCAGIAYAGIILLLIHLVNRALPIYDRFEIARNVTYLSIDGWQSKLDFYRARDAHGPNRTLIHFHGGGWLGGSKGYDSLEFLPFLHAGWNVANVEYRLAETAPAPAAVEDAVCALKWVAHNATHYNVDTSQIVMTGNSAGAHLALSASMMPVETKMDHLCPDGEMPKVAAIVNWYGITDVTELLSGPHARGFARQWFHGATNPETLAQLVSPLKHIRPGLPPIISIHGDADPLVPFAQNLRLHQALSAAGVRNRLITIPGGLHGRFARDDMARAYAEIFTFLDAGYLALDATQAGQP